MGPNFHLVSGAFVSRAQLRQLLQDLGGDEDPWGLFDGGLGTRGGRVWVSWETDEAAETLEKMEEFVNTKRGAQDKRNEIIKREVIERQLGVPPRTFILVDLVSGRPSELLALKFIKAFSDRWPPCVLRDFIPLGHSLSGQHVWTMEELFAYDREHEHLPE